MSAWSAREFEPLERFIKRVFIMMNRKLKPEKKRCVVLKLLNFTITDEAHEKLKEIKRVKGISNNSDAVEFLIDEVHKRMRKAGGN